jgi:type III secretion system FlhB-like substrate exporter
MTQRQYKINHAGRTLGPITRPGMNPKDQSLSAPSSEPVADAIVARIRALARVHGTNIQTDAGLADMLATLKIGDEVPIAPFAVAADLLFRLLAADQRPQAEHAP